MTSSTKLTRRLRKERSDVNDLRNLLAPVRVIRKTRRKVRVRNSYTGGINTTPVSAPAAGTAIVRRTGLPPRISTTGSSTVICNTELLYAAVTTSTFSNSQQALIPGNINWINGIADNYNKWRWLYLRVIYIPSCPTSTSGTVTLGMNYDTTDVQPGSNITAQQAYKSVTGPVWAGWEGSSLLQSYGGKMVPGAIAIDVDIDRLGGPIGPSYYRYVTITNYTAMTAIDKNLYSPCLVNISTNGGPTVSVAAGNVFVEYCCELIEPESQILNS